VSAELIPTRRGGVERPQATRQRVERLWLEREVGQGRAIDPATVAAEFGIGIDHARQLLRDLRLARELPTPTAGGIGDGWRDQAACLDEDPELFFPEQGEWAKARQAKAVCQRCAVRGPCLHDALNGPQATHDETGIFGGTTPRERRGLRRRTWTGAPAPATRDRDLLVQALERARHVGREQAASELGISRVALTKAWERFGLEPPPRRVGGRVPPSRFYTDRAAAEAILARAREVGMAAAAREAGVSRIALDSAWRRWGLERPALPLGRRPGRPEPAAPLDDSFLALNPKLAATLPRRASSKQIAARLRRLEELETLTPRVRSELHDENVPRPAAREFFIARRARQAIERQGAGEVDQPSIAQAEERRRTAERLARAHARYLERQEHDRAARARALELGEREL
jgi:WhiB family transcriptional regulator, redox-sensing transcriptional regulator